MKMERESFWTKLRRLGTTVENETARLEENMKKPIGLRSSGKSNRKPSQLIFKEMRQEAQNVKKDAQQTLHTMKSESQDFQTILKAVKSLFEVQKIQIQEYEDYLEQYGYVPYKEYQRQQQQANKQTSSKKAKANDKENIPQELKSDDDVLTGGKNEAVSAVVLQERNDVLATPPKTNQQESDTDKEAGSKTPQLSDFGLSQATMDRLAMMKMPKSTTYTAGQPGVAAVSARMQATPVRSDRTFNITNAPFPPMTTPLNQPDIPFSMDTVRVTPGIFGNRYIPSNTPEHFIDKALPNPDMEDSPVPPILSTVKKWPKSSHMALPPPPTFDDDINGRTTTPDLPEPPEMTVAWSEFIHVPAAAPQFQPNPSCTSDVTPPMPVFQTCTLPASTMPAAPTRLATKYESNTMPEAPVQLASQVQHGAEMPSRPVLLADKLGIATIMPQEPVQLASQIPSNDGTPPPPVLLTQRFGASHYIPSQLSQQSLTSIPQTTSVPPTATPQHPLPMTMNQQQHQYQAAMATSNIPKAVGGLPPSAGGLAPSASGLPPSASGLPPSAGGLPLAAGGLPPSAGGLPPAAGGLPLSGVTPQKPASVMRLQDVYDEMPKTPELTMSYKRFVDVAHVATVQPTPQEHSGQQQQGPVGADGHQQQGPVGAGGHQQQGPVGTGQSQDNQRTRPCQIALITPEEFSGQQDYLRRILPLNVINTHIDTLNQILQCKQDSSYITEEETKIVDLGPQLKVMLLLLSKLERWKKGKSPVTNETAFFIL
ncbi:uncharacterized protein [Amphiura filiformis]|uniref:uncharacterized protein n=1 Tax=Amphiura filiformis TaxID=82378 RepID=UPI003B216493